MDSMSGRFVGSNLTEVDEFFQDAKFRGEVFQKGL